jgi:hypothetical protein
MVTDEKKADDKEEEKIVGARTRNNPLHSLISIPLQLSMTATSKS